MNMNSSKETNENGSKDEINSTTTYKESASQVTTVDINNNEDINMSSSKDGNKNANDGEFISVNNSKIPQNHIEYLKKKKLNLKLYTCFKPIVLSSSDFINADDTKTSSSVLITPPPQQVQPLPPNHVITAGTFTPLVYGAKMLHTSDKSFIGLGGMNNMNTTSMKKGGVAVGSQNDNNIVSPINIMLKNMQSSSRNPFIPNPLTPTCPSSAVMGHPSMVNTQQNSLIHQRLLNIGQPTYPPPVVPPYRQFYTQQQFINNDGNVENKILDQKVKNATQNSVIADMPSTPYHFHQLQHTSNKLEDKLEGLYDQHHNNSNLEKTNNKNSSINNKQSSIAIPPAAAQNQPTEVEVQFDGRDGYGGAPGVREDLENNKLQLLSKLKQCDDMAKALWPSYVAAGHILDNATKRANESKALIDSSARSVVRYDVVFNEKSLGLVIKESDDTREFPFVSELISEHATKSPIAIGDYVTSIQGICLFGKPNTREFAVSLISTSKRPIILSMAQGKSWRYASQQAAKANNCCKLEYEAKVTKDKVAYQMNQFDMKRREIQRNITVIDSYIKKSILLDREKYPRKVQRSSGSGGSNGNKEPSPLDMLSTQSVLQGNIGCNKEPSPLDMLSAQSELQGNISSNTKPSPLDILSAQSVLQPSMKLSEVVLNDNNNSVCGGSAGRHSFRNSGYDECYERAEYRVSDYDSTIDNHYRKQRKAYPMKRNNQSEDEYMDEFKQGPWVTSKSSNRINDISEKTEGKAVDEFITKVFRVAHEDTDETVLIENEGNDNDINDDHLYPDIYEIDQKKKLKSSKDRKRKMNEMSISPIKNVNDNNNNVVSLKDKVQNESLISPITNVKKNTDNIALSKDKNEKDNQYQNKKHKDQYVKDDKVLLGKVKDKTEGSLPDRRVRKKKEPYEAQIDTHCKWERDEHTLFVDAFLVYGDDWGVISTCVDTRSASSVMRHYHHFFRKMNEGISAGRKGKWTTQEIKFYKKACEIRQAATGFENNLTDSTEINNTLIEDDNTATLTSMSSSSSSRPKSISKPICHSLLTGGSGSVKRKSSADNHISSSGPKTQISIFKPSRNISHSISNKQDSDYNDEDENDIHGQGNLLKVNSLAFVSAHVHKKSKGFYNEAGNIKITKSKYVDISGNSCVDIEYLSNGLELRGIETCHILPYQEETQSEGIENASGEVEDNQIEVPSPSNRIVGSRKQSRSVNRSRKKVSSTTNSSSSSSSSSGGSSSRNNSSSSSSNRNNSSSSNSSSSSSGISDGMQFRVGMKIEALYKGLSVYYPGVIARSQFNGNYDVDYDDGEKEVHVPGKLIRLLEPPSARSRRVAAKSNNINSSSNGGNTNSSRSWRYTTGANGDSVNRRKMIDEAFKAAVEKTKRDNLMIQKAKLLSKNKAHQDKLNVDNKDDIDVTPERIGESKRLSTGLKVGNEININVDDISALGNRSQRLLSRVKKRMEEEEEEAKEDIQTCSICLDDFPGTDDELINRAEKQRKNKKRRFKTNESYESCISLSIPSEEDENVKVVITKLSCCGAWFHLSCIENCVMKCGSHCPLCRDKKAKREVRYCVRASADEKDKIKS